MAAIRIFLLTYRRPQLLRRALDSLRAQTFTDWVCELHNDATDDLSPAELLAEINDPRITLHHHAHNWGPVAAFNHACAGTAPEPFFSILEDDNWWEPVFLERLLAALQSHPQAELAWSNLNFWQEETDGGWKNLGRTLWPVVPYPVVSIATPQLIQFDGPLHSNGAMLLRTSAAHSGRLLVPVSLPFSAMEAVRERSFRPPVLLIPEPLANFALTLTTSRGNRLDDWMALQCLMALAFIKHIPLTSEAMALIWQSRRSAHPRATSLLFFAGMLAASPRFLKHANAKDWLCFVAGVIRHPRIALAALLARRTHPDYVDIWAEATRQLAKTRAATLPPNSVPPLTLVCPADLVRHSPSANLSK